jgi:hypothetical protein
MFKDGPLGLRMAILCMLVLLIITLYTIDRVHQVWLAITVEHARTIEQRIGFQLTTVISDKFDGRDSTLVGFVFVLLIATCAMFWASIPLTEENILGGHRIVIYAAASVALFWMTGLQLANSIPGLGSKLWLAIGGLIIITAGYVMLKS